MKRMGSFPKEIWPATRRQKVPANPRTRVPLDRRATETETARLESRLRKRVGTTRRTKNAMKSPKTVVLRRVGARRRAAATKSAKTEMTSVAARAKRASGGEAKT